AAAVPPPVARRNWPRRPAPARSATSMPPTATRAGPLPAVRRARVVLLARLLHLPQHVGDRHVSEEHGLHSVRERLVRVRAVGVLVDRVTGLQRRLDLRL